MREDRSNKKLLVELEKLRQRIAELEAEAEKRLQIEEALRQSEEFSSRVLRDSPDPILVANPDTSIRYVNPALEELTGYSMSEIIGQKIPRPWWPEEVREKLEHSAKAAYRHGHKGLEYCFKKKNGERFWVQTTATPVFIDGQFRHFIDSWVDITERKKAEEDIRKFKVIADNAVYGVSIADMAGHLIYANESYARMHGYKVDELIGSDRFKLYPEDQHEFMMRRTEQIKETGSAAGELWRKKKDGTVFSTFSVATLVKDDQGKPLYIATSHFDLTERKQAEAALRTSEEKFSRAFHSNPHPMSIVTMAEGRYLDVNDSYVQTFGFSREELLGHTTIEMGIIKTERFRKELLRILGKKQQVKNLEVELYTRSGRKVEALLSADKIEIGGQTCLLTVLNDITERKKIEAALRESEQRLAQLYNEAPVGYHELDGEGRMTRVNRTELDMLGYTAEEMLGRHVWGFMIESEISRRAFAAKITGTMPPGQAFERTYIRKDGTPMPALIEDRYIKDDSGQVIGLRSTMQDITERKKMEEQLIVTGRLASIGELASGVAHELNNPLTSIIGFSELLLNKDIPDDVREDLKVIHREAQRTAQVVRNLLTFARKHETTKKPVDINQAIKSALDLRAYEQKVHNIEVVTNFDSSLPEITADIFRLQQVFVNIIINAEYFMVQAHGKGKLTITTERKGDVIRASFADDGPGIREEHLRHVFDPFFTTKEVGKGTGLGLSICHGIVTEHGGNIYVKSQLNRGATFIVDLPIK